MPRSPFILALACAVAAGCGGGSGPTGPTPKVPRLSRTRFMAFGDSLTTGEVTAPIGAAGGIGKLIVVAAAAYPSVLQSQLQAAYPPQSSAISVSNQGKGGETIFDGVLRFEDVFPGSRAEVVLIQEGVNGLQTGGPDASTSLMRVMVQQAKGANAKVFVGSMIPTLAGRQRTQDAAALVAYNTVLQIMCTQEGVTYVDLYNGILPAAETLIGIDGLHPTEAGYRRIADLYFAAIKRELEE